jgi:hypothetical protein
MIPTVGSSPPGFTASERYLARLCERSFLSLWSHPNLFRNQNKELCDLLVVFGEHIVVFSDKCCEFPDKEDRLAWSRWYRRAIKKSADQLYRAEAWLRSFPDRIFLDAQCIKRFPLPLPHQPKIHLVAVAIGAARACREYFGGGSGSLLLAPDADGSVPFIIGDLEPCKPFVHVFDDISLDLVLSELDTTPDFIHYLERKEAFIRSGGLSFAAGEEDLLAHYLGSINDDTGGHDFMLPARTTQIGVGEIWNEHVQSDEYKAKKKADACSYIWDQIIEHIASHAMRGTLAFGHEHGLASHEASLRILASEPRLHRRMLGMALQEVFERSDREGLFARFLTCDDKSEGHRYVFFTLKRVAVRDSEHTYRRIRQTLLVEYCRTTKLRRPSVHSLTGLAFSAKSDGDSSIDIVRINFDNWNEDDARRADAFRRKMRWSDGSDLPEAGQSFEEYPVERTSAPQAQPRRAKTTKSAYSDARRRKRKAQRQARRHKRK